MQGTGAEIHKHDVVAVGTLRKDTFAHQKVHRIKHARRVVNKSPGAVSRARDAHRDANVTIRRHVGIRLAVYSEDRACQSQGASQSKRDHEGVAVVRFATQHLVRKVAYHSKMAHCGRTNEQGRWALANQPCKDSHFPRGERKYNLHQAHTAVLGPVSGVVSRQQGGMTRQAIGTQFISAVLSHQGQARAGVEHAGHRVRKANMRTLHNSINNRQLAAGLAKIRTSIDLGNVPSLARGIRNSPRSRVRQDRGSQGK